MEKEEDLDIVNKLRESTKEYKKLLLESKHPTMSKIVSNQDLLETMRDTLVKDYELIDYIIFNIGDKPKVTYGLTPEDFCAYEASYEENQGKLFKTLPALEMCIEDLLRITKKIILIDNESFKDHYGDRNKPEKVQVNKSFFQMLFEPFMWMFNFIIRNKITCLVITTIILVFIGFMIN